MREPSRDLSRMRHILVHDYFKINLDVLWEVIKKDIPVLKAQVEQYITEIR